MKHKLKKYDIVYSKNKVEYYFYDNLHREGSPAIIKKSEDSYFEQYFFNGLRHREDGPSATWKQKNFTVVFHDYHLMGVRIYSSKEYYRKAKSFVKRKDEILQMGLDRKEIVELIDSL